MSQQWTCISASKSLVWDQYAAHVQAYMVGPRGVLRRALFSRGVGARLVAVRGLLYMIVQQLRTMEEGEGSGIGDEALEADPELSLSQVPCMLHSAKM